MGYFLKNAPEIIKAAATSILGVFALMILILALLTLVFFKDAPIKVRIWIFVMLFAGVVGFGSTVAYQSAESEKNSSELERKTGSANPEQTVNQPEDTNASAKAEANRVDYVISDEARQNLEWIFQDNGAAKTYQAARNVGNSRYQAALIAESGPNQQGAYRSIVASGRDNVEKYLIARGRP